MVYEDEHYPGIFRDKEGKSYDLRPSSDDIIRPSIQAFSKMNKIKL